MIKLDSSLDLERLNCEVGLTEPVLVRGMSEEWPLHDYLTFSSLSERHGHETVTVRRPDAQRRLPLDLYLYYTLNCKDDNPYYLSNWNLKSGLSYLRDKYSVPSPLQSWFDHADPERDPNLRWIFIGPAQTETPPHVDVLMTSAWNVLTAGAKKWKFWAPDSSRTPWESTVPDETDLGEPNAEFIQHPGALVVTPSGWIHSVKNLSPSIALTENYINETNHKIVERYLNVKERYDLLETIRHLKPSHLKSQG